MSRSRKRRESRSKDSNNTPSSSSDSGSVDLVAGQEQSATEVKKGFFRSGKYFWWRFGFLLVIFVPLTIYGVQKITWDRKIQSVHRLLETRNDRKAISQIRELENRFGKRAEFDFLFARAYRHLADVEMAEKHLEFAQQLGYPKSSVLREQQLVATQYGDTVEIESKLQEFLSNDDFSIDEIFSSLVLGYLMQSRFADASKALSVWMQEAPDSPAPSYYLGLIAQYQRKWESAEVSLKRALKQEPNFLPAVFALAENYTFLNRHDQAVPLYREFLEVNVDSYEAKIGLAKSLLGSNQVEEALVLMRELSTELATFDPRVLLGKTELDAGNPQKAIEVLEPIASEWPEDVDLNYALGRAYSQIGNDSKADQYLETSEKSRKLISEIDQLVRKADAEPGNFELRYEIGHRLLHYRDRDQGRASLFNALAINPSYLPAHRDLVLYFTKQGDIRNAAYHSDVIRQIESKSSSLIAPNQPTPK